MLTGKAHCAGMEPCLVLLPERWELDSVCTEADLVSVASCSSSGHTSCHSATVRAHELKNSRASSSAWDPVSAVQR